MFRIMIDSGRQSKSQQIYNDILSQIIKNQFAEGQQLPTERELVKRYDVSRPTISKALSQLQRDGLITRRPGSGSYVRSDVRKSEVSETSRTCDIGLLIPRLGITEIFEPICARIAQLSQLYDFNLLWGSSAAHNIEDTAIDLENACKRFITKKVDGIFFVPLELVPDQIGVNNRLVKLLSEAEIPVVLLDSDYLPFGKRGIFDLVGIDNVKAGYLAAQHYLDQGAQRVDFFFRSFSASTVKMRLQGCRLALSEKGILMPPQWIHEGESQDLAFVREVISSGGKNFVCANDFTAISLMRSLQKLGLSIPEDVRVVGFDNIKYAEYSLVPLTTFHQPCYELGELAVDMLMLRIKNPLRPVSAVLTEPKFLIRKSSIISDS